MSNKASNSDEYEFLIRRHMTEALVKFYKLKTYSGHSYRGKEIGRKRAYQLVYESPFSSNVDIIKDYISKWVNKIESDSSLSKATALFKLEGGELKQSISQRQSETLRSLLLLKELTSD